MTPFLLQKNRLITFLHLNLYHNFSMSRLNRILKDFPDQLPIRGKVQLLLAPMKSEHISMLDFCCEFDFLIQVLNMLLFIVKSHISSYLTWFLVHVEIKNQGYVWLFYHRSAIYSHFGIVHFCILRCIDLTTLTAWEAFTITCDC